MSVSIQIYLFFTLFPPQQVEIVPPYNQTLNGELFHRLDIEIGDGNRLLLFYSNNDLSILCRSPTIFMDGTFKAAPRLFYQLYTIHGTVGPYVYPLVYCLTTRKSQDVYTTILTHLQAAATELGFVFEPVSVTCDFERATINAIQEVFPETNVTGCLFHWTQSVWRHIVSLGLKRLYSDDQNVKSSILMLLALPFVPPADIVDVFVQLRQEIIEMGAEVVLPLWDYIDKTYVRGVPARGRRRAVPPLFVVDLWNVYDACLCRVHRTNNYVEAFHSLLARKIQSPHPNIWKFLQYLQEEQAKNTQQFVQIVQGGHRRIKHAVSRKYLDQQNFIDNMVADYQLHQRANNIPLYLRSISYRLKRPAFDGSE